MNRQQAKELLPIIKAFAEGKTIEKKHKLEDENKWTEVNLPTFNVALNDYRIKPTGKYRPFKDREECWEEMQKHQPFGWVKNRETGRLSLIESLEEYLIIDGLPWYFDRALSTYIFTDGTPFGIKE